MKQKRSKKALYSLCFFLLLALSTAGLTAQEESEAWVNFPYTLGAGAEYGLNSR
jgi:hypothetical protein